MIIQHYHLCNMTLLRALKLLKVMFYLFFVHLTVV